MNQAALYATRSPRPLNRYGGSFGKIQSFMNGARCKARLRGKALSLRAGDSRDKVIERLGKPAMDRTSNIAGKKTNTGTLKYYLRTGAPGGPALDEYVDVYLDQKGRVDAVYMSVELK